MRFPTSFRRLGLGLLSAVTIVTLAGRPAPAAAPRNEFLATNRTFGDFELRLEYRLDCVSDCNAGIQFRTVRIPNHHEVIGYQADIGPSYDGCL